MDPTECTLDVVMKNIYASCDPEQSNMVRASTLLDFIQPYLAGEDEALRKLHALLDPENKNIYVSSDTFYEVLGTWANQISGNEGHEDVFNQTPSNLEAIDEKQLPFVQSTPRASFGDKLLRSEGILNLSNVSPDTISVNISGGVQIQDKSSVAADKMRSLEDHIHYLEHQVGKLTSDADMLKTQLALADEQNDNLLKEMERLKIRLHSEQQLTDHLQKQQKQNEDLTDELNNHKAKINKLEILLQQYKKDSMKWASNMKELDEKNAELDENCRTLMNKERDLWKQIFDMSEELSMKDNKISELTEDKDKLSKTLQICNVTIEELTNDYELLDYKRNSLEKVISLRRYSYSSHNNALSESMNLSLQGTTTIPIYSSNTSLHEVLTPVRHSSTKKCSSTPRKAERLCDLNHKHTPVSLNKSIAFLPHIIRSLHSPNIVQDISYDEDFPMSQLDGYPKTSCNTLQNELMQASSSCDGVGVLQHEKEALKFNLNKAIEENDELQETISMLEQKMQATILAKNTSIDEINANCETLRKQLECDTNKLSSLETDYNQVLGDLLLKTSECSQLSECADNYKQVVAELENKLQEIISDKNENCKQIKEFQEQVCELERMVQEYKEGSDKSSILEVAYKRAQGELHRKSLENNDLLKSVHDYKKTINKMNSTIEEQADSLKIIQKELEEYKKLFNNTPLNNNALEKNILLKDFEDELIKKDTEIKTLRLELKRDSGVKKQLFENNKELQESIKNLKLENLTYASKIKDIEVELNEMQKQEARNNSEQLNELSRKNEELLIENKGLYRQIKAMAAELTQIKDMYDNVNKKKSDLLEEVTTLASEIQTLKTEQKLEFESTSTQFKLERNKNEELASKNTELATHLDHLQEELDAEVVKNVELSGIVSEFMNKIAVAMAVLEEECRNGDTAHTHFIDVISDLRNEMSESPFVAKNIDHSALVNQLKKKTDYITTQCKKMFEKHNSLTVENANLVSKIIELESRRENNTVLVETYQNTLDQLSRQKQTLERQYNDEVAKNMELAARVCHLESVKDKYCIEHCKNQKLSEEQGKLQNQLSKLNQDYEKLQLNKAELHIHITKLENEIDSDTNRSMILKKDYEQKTDKCKKLGEQVFELKSRVEYFKHNHDMLLEKYEQEVSSHKECTLKVNELESKLQNSLKDLTQQILELKSSLVEKCEIIKKMETEKAHLKLTCFVPKHKDFSKRGLLIDKLREKVEELNEKLSFEVSKSNILNSELCDTRESEAEMKKQLDNVQIKQASFRTKLQVSSTDDNKLDEDISLTGEWLELDLLSMSEENKNMLLQKLGLLFGQNVERSLKLDLRVNSLERDINHSKEVLKKINKAIVCQVEMMSECNKEVKRVYLLVKGIADNLYHEDKKIILPDIIECKNNEFYSLTNVMKQNVNIIALVLETLSKKSLFIMDKRHVDQSTLRQLSPTGDSKQLKTYTLKYTGSETPDAHSLEISEVVDTTEEDIGSFIKSCGDRPTILEAFDGDALCKLPMLDLDLSFREVFPHLTDNFLLKLGIEEDKSEEEPLNEDQESRYAQFINNFEFDLSTIKEKLGQQIELCQEQHQQCFSLLSELTSYIKDHNCTGQGDSLNLTYFQLQDLRSLLPEIVRSSFTLGTLNCGNRMIKCWNFLFNHMTQIQQRHQYLIKTDSSEVDSTRSECLDQSEPESTEDIAESVPQRWFGCLRSAIKWIMFLAVLIVLAIIYFQLEIQSHICRVTNPLTGFIKKVNLGQTPFY